MRTISGTLSTREKAEAARRRLEALGIERERISFKEVGEPESGSIFVTAKVAPEQVESATEILKSGEEAPGPASAPQRPESFETDAAAPSRPPVPQGDREARIVPPERMERTAPGPQPQTRAESAGNRQPGSVRVARMAAIAALLAGLGFALGAALGILA